MQEECALPIAIVWTPAKIGCPIKGSQWSKGEYLNANNPEDELSLIGSANNDLTYRPDDTGETLVSSRYLELYADGSANAEGVITISLNYTIAFVPVLAQLQTRS